MQPPDNERKVLTWVRDRAGFEYWQTDSFFRPKFPGDKDFWIEANVWTQKVLYWQELPPKPQYEEGE